MRITIQKRLDWLGRGTLDFDVGQTMRLRGFEAVGGWLRRRLFKIVRLSIWQGLATPGLGELGGTLLRDALNPFPRPDGNLTGMAFRVRGLPFLKVRLRVALEEAANDG